MSLSFNMPKAFLNEEFREIFGPLLPIVPVESVDDAYNIVRDRCVSRFTTQWILSPYVS